MTKQEFRSLFSLSAIMSLRMIGLFMVLPLLTLYAQTLNQTTPLLIGFALGIYGLTQGLLQMPFGAFSDRIGRKPIIAFGLFLFITGSILAASTNDIYLLILARALQGAGAIGSTVIATLADLTSEEHRTKAMAFNGMLIGLSFAIAMVLGPTLSAWLSVPALFWASSIFGIIAFIILLTCVPNPKRTPLLAQEKQTFLSILQIPHLLQLDIGVFLLHAIFIASFIAIPITLLNQHHIPANQQWWLYLPALIISFIIAIFLITKAEKAKQSKQLFCGGILLLMASEAFFAIQPASLWSAAIAMTLFFTGFNLLEAQLPSMISRLAPSHRKGTALGIYSSCQFLGIFVGGTVGGWLLGHVGLQGIYLFCVMFAIIWLGISLSMTNPQQQTPLPNIIHS